MRYAPLTTVPAHPPASDCAPKDLIPHRHNSNVDRLFEGLHETATQVWMSHGDKLGKLPEGFCTIATTKNSPYAGIAHETKPIFGLQFHPEVTHILRGKDMLKNFAVGICGAQANWNMSNFIEQEIARIRKLVGPPGQVIGAVSGGVDSTVAAKLSTALRQGHTLPLMQVAADSRCSEGGHW